MTDVDAIVAGLRPRPTAALLGWPIGDALEWPDIVKLAAKEGDRRVMSFHAAVRPLLARGLLEVAEPHWYDPVSGVYRHTTYAPTPLGLAVRAKLEASNG